MLVFQQLFTFLKHAVPLKTWQIKHRGYSIDIERANINCQGIACNRYFYMGLASAEGQKLVFR